jgi:DNA-binding NarL/FixJ family response regulator
MTKLRVVLADDHALVRAGIRALIEMLGDVEVVGEARDGEEALRIVVEVLPDIVLIDFAMPGSNGLSTIETLIAKVPEVKIIILSMHGSKECVVNALRAGAVGYLLKDAATEELGAAIRTVASGKKYLSPALADALITISLGKDTASRSQPQLTVRQRQVLCLVVAGQTMKEIASTLGLSVKTVEAHRSQMTERLGIHDVPGLVRYAMRMGLIEPELPRGD